jgi:flagellar biogenesis protein FliO
MEPLWKLFWALPLVLIVGAGAMLLLKRFIVPVARAGQPSQRMQTRESLVLSEQTRLHLVDIDGKTYLVTESAHRTQLQSLSAGDAPGAMAPAWLRRLQKGATR